MITYENSVFFIKASTAANIKIYRSKNLSWGVTGIYIECFQKQIT